MWIGLCHAFGFRYYPDCDWESEQAAILECLQQHLDRFVCERVAVGSQITRFVTLPMMACWVLTGKIPEEFADLSDLILLDLSGNNFQGL